MAGKNLSDLEAIIEMNRSKFYQTGKALRRIRDLKLYRQLLFKEFEAYVKQRWDMARSHAYRLIEASKVIDNLSPIGDGILPQNESQARALSILKPEEQRAVWREFIVSGAEINAFNIQKLVRMSMKKGKSSSSPKSDDLTEVISTDYKKTVIAMIEQIRLAQNDGWRNTSKQAALFWLRVMKEKILSAVNEENRA